MSTLVITIHVIACLLLIVVVLLQSGQEGMGVIFGGGSSSMFGSSGAGGLLVKITTVLAAVFLVTSLTYNVLSGNKLNTSAEESVMTQGEGLVTPAPNVDKPSLPVEENAAQPAAPATGSETK